ncbi:sugar phosphate isomerase/epimerase family protein [Halomicrobium salinisoli]|uniref:sugar phosphate isomerase/epimerase family protein n=1 Tax=Halomicrobium salinisoli TaxID=2878391 RepID=UPI001CEFE805|nr:sugar phosphate isomerase/epimerase [Halomicrobium salinisoli]
MPQKATDRSERSESKSLDVNRREVLQGIGAAGVATTFAATAASGQTDSWQSEATAAEETADDIPISTQFYSYRETGLSITELIHEAADAGYDAFEPYRVGAGTDVDPILQAANDTGLEMSSAHISLSEVENNTQAMIDTFSQFGDPILIDPGVAPDGGWGSESAVVDLAERFNAAADMLSDTDLAIGHHNHDAEFAQIGDTTGYDIFAENLDDQVQIQLDVGWVLVGGADPIRFITDHPENVRTLHMKNMTVDPEAFTEFHEGDVNMRAVANAVRNAGDPEYLVFEHDEPEDPLESMQLGAEGLEKVNQPWHPGGICAVDADTHPAKLHNPA